MKIQLLIAAGDRDYTDHMSWVLAEKHIESFEVTVCSVQERLAETTSARVFDVVLAEPEFVALIDTAQVKLVFVLWDGISNATETPLNIEKIYKYQRISRINSTILEKYSKIAGIDSEFTGKRAKITAVWSPAGGVGKTTVALAYATKKVATGTKVTYLDFEFFSSTSVYFQESGKSISSAFGNLDGNVSLLLKAIALKDDGNGVTYFTPPENYDDMNELTAHDIETFITAASEGSGELIVDLPSACDARVRTVLEKADDVLIVTDGTKTTTAKLGQFITQHNIFERIRSKSVLIANRNAKSENYGFNRTVALPLIASNNPVSVYKTLSGVSF